LRGGIGGDRVGGDRLDGVACEEGPEFGIDLGGGGERGVDGGLWGRLGFGGGELRLFPGSPGAEEVGFVGEANADEGAAGALGAVFERRRELSGTGDRLQFGDELPGAGDELVVKFDFDPFAGGDVVDDP
jgi:hypothetical protein